MDVRDWRGRIEAAKKRDAEAKARFQQDMESGGIEHAAQWSLQAVTEARVNLTWWLRIEKHIGETADADAIEEVFRHAHEEILTATTTHSTCPVRNFIAANGRDALARWYTETEGMYRKLKLAAAVAIAMEGTK